jgi:2-epi-5-epi-valiolone synthase
MQEAAGRALSEHRGEQWLRSVRAVREERYDILCRPGLLSRDDETLVSLLRTDAPALVVMTPSTDRLYGKALRHSLAAHGPGADLSFMILACSEADKMTEQVLAVCRRAVEARLARRSQIVCVGGGVALDICGLAATLFRRGICQIRVPTTLIGMIDAGIGVKNGVNFDGSKSLLGSFSACEACLIDPSFLDTLPRRHLQCGLAESAKIATVCSPELFDLLDMHADGLLGPICGTLLGQTHDLIRLSIEGTLSELSLNLFERRDLFPNTYARKLDFGHTFSPYLEAASGHILLHGEAVAIDMAVSVELAYRLGVLDRATRTRVLDLIYRLGLPIHWPELRPEALRASLPSVVRHRDGALNLVLPSGIGTATFLKDLRELSLNLLTEVVQDLAEWPAKKGALDNARARR